VTRAAALAQIALSALLGGCGATQPMSDWERNNRELLAAPQTAATPAPPPFPRREDLIEFYVGPRVSFKYFVDAASLTPLWKQGEIRSVLVARSPSGVDNVSFETLRCAGQYRVIAIGNPDRTWSLRPGEWREVERKSDVNAQSRLKAQFFCPHNDPIQSTAEGIEALRKGGHPMVWLPENYDRR
jgi:hypothetical protein